MKEFETQEFNKGIYNIIRPANIPTTAAQASLNWRSFDDRIEFTGGRIALGDVSTTVTAGGVRAGYYINIDYSLLWANTDTTVKQNFGILKVVGRKLYTWVDPANKGQGTWQAIPKVGTSNTDLFDEGEEIFLKRTLNEYTSLSGRFIYISGSKSNIYKIDPFSLNTPYAAATAVYDSAKNYLGNFFFDKSRTCLWDRIDDPTGTYLSKIDPQGPNYHTVTGESISITANIVNTRLAAALANQKRHVFGLLVTTPSGTFRDDKEGGFVNTSTGVSIPRYSATSVGVSASIIYNTGQILFHLPGASGSITVDYQWEDPTDDGVWDFTFTIPRLTGEGDIIRQDAGGLRTLNVIPYRGVYYSIKKDVAYAMVLDASGNVVSNEIFARNLGITNRNSIIATDLGIIYIDTTDKTFPRLKILQNVPYGSVLQPTELAKQFRFADFDYTNAYIEIYNNNALISCQSLISARNSGGNDRVLFYNMRNDSVDVFQYRANCLTQGGQRLFGGDTVTADVYVMFENYSDNGIPIVNNWTGKDETYGSNRLKKTKWLRVRGRIDIDTNIKVYISYDDQGNQWVGTILGNGSYVDYTGTYSIGTNEIGYAEIGGEDDNTDSQQGNQYYAPIKLFTPKFRTRTITFVVEGLGYASVDYINDSGIMLYEDRMPYKYRVKQYVSLGGKENQPRPNYDTN